jgi:hypothetical protein
VRDARLRVRPGWLGPAQKNRKKKQKKKGRKNKKMCMHE